MEIPGYLIKWCSYLKSDGLEKIVSSLKYYLEPECPVRNFKLKLLALSIFSNFKIKKSIEKVLPFWHNLWTAGGQVVLFDNTTSFW